MSHTVTMDQAGCIVRPKEARRHLHPQPGARLMLAAVAQRVALALEPQADAEP